MLTIKYIDALNILKEFKSLTLFHESRGPVTYSKFKIIGTSFDLHIIGSSYLGMLWDVRLVNRSKPSKTSIKRNWEELPEEFRIEAAFHLNWLAE